jgi:hypothetical protein
MERRGGFGYPILKKWSIQRKPPLDGIEKCLPFRSVRLSSAKCGRRANACTLEGLGKLRQLTWQNLNNLAF